MAAFVPHSDIFTRSSKWASFDPDCVNTLIALVGNDDTADQDGHACARTIVDMSEMLEDASVPVSLGTSQLPLTQLRTILKDGKQQELTSFNVTVEHHH